MVREKPGTEASESLGIGVKIYSDTWRTRYDMSVDEVVGTLRDWGVSFVLTTNRALPVPDSAPSTYDDRALRDALGAAGIDYWITTYTCYAPNVVAAEPALRPVGSDGHPMPTQAWYVGVAPSQDSFIERQIERIAEAARRYQPEGVFLSFTRWPGFWERWLPSHTQADHVDYSYDAYTLARFIHDTGVRLPTHDPAKAAAWIEEHAAETWVDWKCQIVVDVVSAIRDACRAVAPGIRTMLNTLPFRATDFDNAREVVFGQNVERLAEVIDVFEVMTYHQIAKRDVAWIPDAGHEVRRRTGKPTICTIQGHPCYLDGIYAAAERASLDVAEFAVAVDAVQHADVQGLAVYCWNDLLEDVKVHGETGRIEALRAAAQ